MMGARFRGATDGGGDSRFDFCVGPPVGNLAFSHWVSSIFSWPRCTSAEPVATTISCSFLVGSFLMDARLFCLTDAVASSTLTWALESGEVQFGVARST